MELSKKEIIHLKHTHCGAFGACMHRWVRSLCTYVRSRGHFSVIDCTLPGKLAAEAVPLHCARIVARVGIGWDRASSAGIGRPRFHSLLLVLPNLESGSHLDYRSSPIQLQLLGPSKATACVLHHVVENAWEPRKLQEKCNFQGAECCDGAFMFSLRTSLPCGLWFIFLLCYSRQKENDCE